MKSILTTVLIGLFASLSFAQNIKAFKDKDTGFIGFKNAAGEIIIQSSKYEEWNGASEGLILVSKKSKWGFIDLLGNEVIELKYKYATQFFDGLACVALRNNKYGYIDKTGANVIDFVFESAHPFNENTAGVSKNNIWGFIDKSGNIIIDYKYQDVYPFIEGFAGARLNDKWGFIDKTGKEIGEFKYSGAQRFSEGFGIVVSGVKWTFIDKTGREIIEPTYEYIRPFKEGFAAVALQSNYGYIDNTGKLLTEIKYISVEDFKDGLAIVKRSDYRQENFYSFIDKTGKEIPQEWFHSIKKLSPNYFLINDYFGKKGIVTKTGKKIIEMKYDKISMAGGVISAVDAKGVIFKFDKEGELIN